MYESYFGLACEPFSVAPDPRFLYLSDKHREALGYLMYGLRRAGGFVLLTGEIGAGKTTVWRAFLEQLPGHVDVAYVANPKLGVTALLRRLCEELRIELADDQADLIDALHGHLLLAHASGRRTLIAVDEAQALSFDVLEQLRLLTNLVTNESKLVQVLLIGQPELRNMLAMTEMESVSQRVVARFHLPALSLDEVRRYLAHRLEVAGYQGPGLFEDDAIRRLHRLCRGTPRRINVLCDRALLLAFQAGEKRVDRALVDRAAADVFGQNLQGTVPLSRLNWPAWLAGGAAAGAVLAGSLWVVPRLPGSLPKASALAEAVAAASAPAASAAPPAVASVAQTISPRASAVLDMGATALAALNAASAPAPIAPATPAMTDDAEALERLLAAGDVSDDQALRQLASWWGVTLASGEACSAARARGLVCYNARRGLAPIRQLARPGLLTLTDERGRNAHVLLSALDDDAATLQAATPGARPLRVPLARLAWLWRGDFATFWRAPPSYDAGQPMGTDGPQADWLAQQLAQVDGGPPHFSDGEMLRNRVSAFQKVQGIKPDGQVGPMTLMLLNRASGIAEPRLPFRPPAALAAPTATPAATPASASVAAR
ncbi:AAA family ATPase [Ideonella azotifigens]|uniref:ExeA family protein n=2 Tax=Ideonella azotifigens TaxID=513160 RepID=A0ABN1JPT5_9BURK|nr:ExeA family protein [Ideonella azotifigens]MCD2340106.1 AAA family ATPase [Ideonella azotifigens]